MKIQRPRLLAFLLACLALGNACATVSAPAESPLDGAPIVIRAPKDLQHADDRWKGVHLESIDYTREQEDILPGVHSTNNPIRDFFSVHFTDATPGELTTTVCRGEQHPDGHRYRSCVFFDAHVVATEGPDDVRFVVTPWRRRTEQGRNAIFIPIDLPKATVADWYRYLSTQSVVSQHRITSKFSPESLKGNFDRRLPRQDEREREADAALRQFKDAYVIEEKDGTTTRVGAAFYPYRDGALVELVLLGRSRGGPTPTSLDWAATLAAVRAKLDGIAND